MCMLGKINYEKENIQLMLSFGLKTVIDGINIVSVFVHLPYGFLVRRANSNF